MSFLWCRVNFNFRNRQKRFDDFLNCKVFFSQITGFTDGRVIIVRSWAWPEGWVVGTSLKPEWRTPDGHVHVDVCPQRQNFVQSLRENLYINMVMKFASVIQKPKKNVSCLKDDFYVARWHWFCNSRGKTHQNWILWQHKHHPMNFQWYYLEFYYVYMLMWFAPVIEPSCVKLESEKHVSSYNSTQYWSDNKKMKTWRCRCIYYWWLTSGLIRGPFGS